jgi:hypothetical protein
VGRAMGMKTSGVERRVGGSRAQATARQPADGGGRHEVRD